MKHLLQRSLLLILVWITGALVPLWAQDQNRTIRVMSYNIRLNTLHDAPNHWENRKQWVADLILFYQPDFIGLQEVLVDQLNDLKALLPDYACIGVARDDGKEAGEFSPIFYLKTKYQLHNTQTLWLSETPTIPGTMGWDAVCNRVVTQGTFKPLHSPQLLTVLNTHFDHIGKTARKESAKMVVKLAQDQGSVLPTMVMGDFNADPADEVYRILTEAGILKDTYSIAKRKYGPEWTFHGFGSVPIHQRPRIDYVFVGEGWNANSHLQLFEQRDELYPSDHLPVIVELQR